MARPALQRPTDGELAILKVLWDAGRPLIAAKVFQALSQTSPSSRSAFNTRLNIMETKGLVRADSTERPKAYTPAVSRAAVHRQMMKDLAARLYDGSIKKMFMTLIPRKKASAAEMKELERLLDQMDDKGQ